MKNITTMNFSYEEDHQNHHDVELSSDNIFEILSHSSLSTLAKCRQLSKECNSVTYDSSFMNLHRQRSKILSGYFLQAIKRNKFYSTFVSIEENSSSTTTTTDLSIDFLPLPVVKIEASTPQGYLVCVGAKNRIVPQYYICKPSVKEWQVIPNPKTKYFTERIGMIVLRLNPLLHYKVVRFSQPKTGFKGYYCLRCEVFDSITMEWKLLQQVKLSNGEFLKYAPTVSSCGSLHWLTTENNILAFNGEKENHSVFSLPSPVYVGGHYDCFNLVEHQGKLAVICMKKESCMDLWVMENYGQKIWSLRETISVENLRKLESFPIWTVALYNSDIALTMGFYQVIFFKFRNGSKIDKVNLEMNIDFEGVFPFRSDFEPSNLENNKHSRSGKSRRRKKLMPKKEESAVSGFMSSSPGDCQNLSFSLSPSFVFLLLLFAFFFRALDL